MIEKRCNVCDSPIIVDDNLDTVKDLGREYDKLAAEWREQKEEITRLKDIVVKTKTELSECE